jgi:hypothetical protein
MRGGFFLTASLAAKDGTYLAGTTVCAVLVSAVKQSGHTFFIILRVRVSSLEQEDISESGNVQNHAM